MLNRQQVITDRYLLFVFCLSHRLFTLTKACLNLMLDGTRITKRSLKASRSKNPLTDSYYSCEAICIHDKIPKVYSQNMYPRPQTNAVNFILTFCIPRIHPIKTATYSAEYLNSGSTVSFPTFYVAPPSP